MRFRKILPLLAALALIVLLLAGAGVSAAGGDAASYLAFTSDVHYDTSYTQNNLDVWLGHIKSAVPVLDYMGFCGDMGSAYAKTAGAFWTDVQAAMDTADHYAKSGFISKGTVYTLGNHEWLTFAGGDYANNKDNAAAKKYIRVGEAVKTDKYILCCFGAPSAAQGFAQDDIAALQAYLKTAPADIPVVVLSHYPLHAYSVRTSANADAVVDVLNNYPNVIFLWGHNHTLSDTSYDKFFKAGDTITVASGVTRQINFTYCSAGCMSDSEYGAGSHSVAGKGLVMAVRGDTVTLTYYDMQGKPLPDTATVTVGAAVPSPSAGTGTGAHTVVLSGQKVKVNGADKAFEAYNIDGSNYFKLRDIAYVLSGTGSQFSVSYDGANQVISCATGKAYAAVGGELVLGEDKSATAVPSAQKLSIDGNTASLTAFNIGGSNFIKLRDLGAALGFAVDYDDAAKTMLIASK